LNAILRSATDGIVVTDATGEILQANPVAQAWLTQTLSPEDARRLREAAQDIAQQASAVPTHGQQPEIVLELTGLDLELKAPPPVTTIKLYAHLLQRTSPREEKWQAYLTALAQEANRQAQLVEDILQISRIDAGRLEVQPRPISLDELAARAIDSHRVLAKERDLMLEHHPVEPGPMTLVDPERTMQVLNNLVENAIHYTPPGGAVAVSAGQAEAEGRAWATMSVADTEIDIPEDERPHVFERFFRGKEPRVMQVSGTGLGLAIAKEIAELHGGHVTVESQAGKGTTFTIWLPLAV
jgi:two-component system phosphate regulon sensor histidine kinase PhoR